MSSLIHSVKTSCFLGLLLKLVFIGSIWLIDFPDLSRISTILSPLHHAFWFSHPKHAHPSICRALVILSTLPVGNLSENLCPGVGYLPIFPVAITAVIILAWTPKICLECLLWCNQSQTRSSHHRSHKQRTVSYLSRNKLFSFCFNIQSFYKYTIAFPSYLFTVFAIIAKNTGLSDFEINYKANVPGLRTRQFGAQVFKLFVTIEIGSYTLSQVTMLQGKPLEFSDFHRFAANAVSVNTFCEKSKQIEELRSEIIIFFFSFARKMC